jgi:type II secretory pathway component PulL
MTFCFALRVTDEQIIRVGVWEVAMSKTVRHTNWVLVLLASGALVVLVALAALVTAHHSSSDKDQSQRKTSSVEAAKETAPSKAKRTQVPTAQAKAHAKAEPVRKESYMSTRPAGEPARTDPVSSMMP